MKIACLSGKGGAGKTFVAVNLAAVAGQCTYIDCDVEEPNGHLFWQAQHVQTEPVSTLLPSFDATACVGCKACVSFCRFHALIYIKEKPMVFAEVCHSCGGCAMVCPHGAITEQPKPVGVVELGHSGDVTVVTGKLNVGEASGVPVIRSALRHANADTVLDCPPGSACPVMESVMHADYCVLVAEPTAFGLHNIKMVHELATLLGKPCGIVINKETEPYGPLEAFCRDANVPILARIAYDPALGKRIASGEIVARTMPELHAQFDALWRTIGGAV